MTRRRARPSRGPSLPSRGASRQAPPPFRRRLILGVWLVAGVVLLGRSVQLQVFQSAHWSEQADRQQRMSSEVPAARGQILDRSGVAMAVSHETFRVGVAPHELTDRSAVAEALASALEIPIRRARSVTTDSRGWVQISGRYPAAVQEALAGIQGVYVQREIQRFYPHGDLARGMLGVVVDQAGLGGIEEEFEPHLRGIPGAETLARDSEGRPIPGETWVVRSPRIGGSIVLTLDVGLQEIAEQELERAVEANEASGGDLLVTDPRTGEILAMVSIRDGAPGHLGVINTPYEPGSTLKPFTVATLLREERASLEDSVDTGNGTWVHNRRTIRDVAPVGGMLTVAHALQVSSNVGIAKVASVLSEDEQYEGLRDFGFGAPTGIGLPGEAEGTLRRPLNWSIQSAASLAIGYEIAVTPIQLAMAYGALANGGVLMEPRLVREIRDHEGEVVERMEPRAVRRVVSKDIAQQINSALVQAVEVGTGTRARLASFAVAGKSGTTRANGQAGYEEGEYFASFIGFFPADDPQLVVYVKLDRPHGSEYYGGATAAPVTRATLEAILAARNPPLDRGALASIARAQISTSGDPAVAPAVALTRSVGRPGEPIFAARQASTDTEVIETETRTTLGSGAPVAVPQLRNLSPRAAARRLHFMGLHVEWEAGDVVTGTIPRAGTFVTPGDPVRLLTDG